MRTIHILWFLLSVLTMQARPQPGRIVYTINECWETDKGIVSLPHTWNAADATDDTPGYDRGKVSYRKNRHIPVEMEGKQAYIYFEGANQVTEVFVNGRQAGKHIGGYTRFCFDITTLLKYGEENRLLVEVDNSPNEDIPPLAADFTFWGGIYRDVYLMFTDKIHFTVTDYASSGIYVNSTVSEEQAVVSVKNLVSNDRNTSSRFRVETILVSPEGKRVAEATSIQEAEPHAVCAFRVSLPAVEHPMLWSPETPHLYILYSRIYDLEDVLLDEALTAVGLRWFDFSPDSGFRLNGKPCKLIGTNRHQDYRGRGNALPDEMHVRDIKLLKEMGGNFLRVSHYPQDPVVMEMCDKLGILTSVEIPIISTIGESGSFHDNSIQMAKEMVFQDYNRPSVIMWGYMNEIMLHPPHGDNEAKQQGYIKSVCSLAQDIEDFIREADPDRYTMMACHGSFEDYAKVGLTQIPMILGWNVYQGWYSGEFSGFDEFMEKVHRSCPDKPILISEYGADVDTRIHSFSPRRFDFSAEYGNLYHEHYLKSIMQTPYIAGAALWNLNDFYSEARKDAVPHVNNKGITGLDREKKDTYYFYQATLKQEPVLKIGGREWKNRGGCETATGLCLQPMKIYTNLKEIEILLNGKSLGKRKAIDHAVETDVPFRPGINVIEAFGEYGGLTIRDRVETNFEMIPADLNRFTEINVLLGSHRYFEDRDASMLWIPEKEYTPGSWGYVGGKPYERVTRRGVLTNSDKDIAGTDQDPVYQTQRIGMEAFQLDVPDGLYSIYCYWAALEPKKKQDLLIYNLGNDEIGTYTEENTFDVSVNDVTLLYDFSPEQQSKGKYGIIKKFMVNITGGKGISINLRPVRGKPVLNALRVYRNY
jgi:beta-galactosidase